MSADMQEKQVEAKLRKMVESHKGLCLKWVCPGWSGVPDRIVLLPGGVAFFVETKRPKGGKYSPMQLRWAGVLGLMGFMYETVHCQEDIDNLEKVIVVLQERIRGGLSR